MEEKKENIETLKTRLVAINTTIADLEKKKEEHETSLKLEPEYLAIRNSRDKLMAEEQKLDNELNAMRKKISSQFTTNGESPESSETYGKNIKPELFEAINKTFDKKRLASGTYGVIARKMIGYTTQEDKDFTELKERCDEAYRKRGRKDSEIMSYVTEKIREESDAIWKLKHEIHEVEQKISELATNKDDLKEFGKQSRKHALNDYRAECELKFLEVFKNYTIPKNEAV